LAASNTHNRTRKKKPQHLNQEPEPVKSSTKPSAPLNSITEPSKPLIEPVKRATEPLKPATPSETEPVKREIEPVKSATEPLKPATPLNPITEPIKSETEPVKRKIEPVKSATEPLKPAIEQYQAVPQKVPPPSVQHHKEKSVSSDTIQKKNISKNIIPEHYGLGCIGKVGRHFDPDLSKIKHIATLISYEHIHNLLALIEADWVCGTSIVKKRLKADITDEIGIINHEQFKYIFQYFFDFEVCYHTVCNDSDEEIQIINSSDDEQSTKDNED